MLAQRRSILTEEQQRLRKDLLTEKQRTTYYEDQERKQREKADTLSKNATAEPFIIALIDGDGLTFLDELVKDEAEGGN